MIAVALLLVLVAAQIVGCCAAVAPIWRDRHEAADTRHLVERNR